MITKRNPNAYDIYKLGLWLAHAQGQIYDGSSWGATQMCLEALSEFKHVKGLEFIGIEAERERKTLGKKYQDDLTALGEVDRHRLHTSTMRWYGRLEEVSKRWILSLPQAHIDVAKLAAGSKSFLEDEEWNILESLEQHGLNEAASCLLFNNFTSAEFIALRTAESLLRRWYEKKTGNRLKRERWGDILNELNELYPKRLERPKELSLLDYLRERRNEIDHPEAISNPEQATATFLNVIAVCKAVKSELLP
jgi:hypothetical protein